ncbi:MAG: ATP-binding protein [Oscillospiraceae bacterium]|nr:ATP-binding protein [Oscillospiraceae bacterium]
MMKQHYFIMGYGEFTGHEGLQPDWNAEETDLETLYFERLGHIGKYGFGIWAEYRMFQMKLSDNTEKGYVLKPVSSPDAIQLSELVGYEPQRKQVIDNTKALLNGLNASNILLYGSAGTGKSATVKAVANSFAGEGLRLIELSKNELHLLPELLEELHANPLKFILFIDDLSFQENDDDFSALKAVLEGSISARANNTVIYATSNRRHIVRETFSQRAGDEVHRNDTVQETISLSERFGIQILFDKPNKDLYLEIVQNLAEEAGLRTDADVIALKAEQFAMRKSGRSARAAKQFVEQLRCAEYQEES